MIIADILDELNIGFKDFSKILFNTSRKKVIFFPCSKTKVLKSKLKNLYEAQTEVVGNCEILKFHKDEHEIVFVFNMPCIQRKR